LEVTKPNEEVTIDLNQALPKPAMRRVVLRFVGADKGLSPSGTVEVHSMNSGQTIPPIVERLTIQNSTIEFDAFAQGHVSYSIRNLVGYWFPSGTFQVTPGEQPLEHEIKVATAGAVRGHVLNADGTPTDNAQIGARIKYSSGPGHSYEGGIDNVGVNVQGEFFLSPIPFGATCVPKASRGFENAVGDQLIIDEEHVSPTIKLQFPLAKPATVEVVGPDGKPCPRVAVHLSFVHPLCSTSYGPPGETDEQGRCTFDRLSVGVGEYYVTVGNDKANRTERILLDVGGPPVRIELDADMLKSAE
jgi:hypothetical protein